MRDYIRRSSELPPVFAFQEVYGDRWKNIEDLEKDWKIASGSESARKNPQVAAMEGGLKDWFMEH